LISSSLGELLHAGKNKINNGMSWISFFIDAMY
jgi:hypothetical protein